MTKDLWKAGRGRASAPAQAAYSLPITADAKGEGRYDGKDVADVVTEPFIVLRDARYRIPLWRRWSGPWNLRAGQWARHAKETWRPEYDDDLALACLVLGPRVPEIAVEDQP